MADRGDYRPFFSAFWDDPDVHALSHLAYRVLTTLKGTLQAAGIGVVYHEVLATRCAMSSEETERALLELEAPTPGKDVGWIVRERNVVWLVNGLRFEPTLSFANKNHRAFITDRVLAPLGERPIVMAFRRHYAEWFPLKPSSQTDTPATDKPKKAKGIEGASNAPPMVSEGYLDPSPAQPSPAQPDSIPFQPSPARAREALAAAAGGTPVTDANIAAYAEGLALATNRAIAERWGPQEKPIQPFGITRSIASALLTRGIPLDVAQTAIAEKCRAGRFASVPGTVAYFQEPIVEAFLADQQRRREREASRTTSPAHISRAIAVDQQLQEDQLQDLYAAERAPVVQAWRTNPANAEQLAAIEADALEQFPKGNAFSAPARVALVTQSIARAAGFPEYDTWKLALAKAS